MQRCLSGLRSTTGNRVYLARVPRVQIPLSAPNEYNPNLKSIFVGRGFGLFLYFDFILYGYIVTNGALRRAKDSDYVVILELTVEGKAKDTIFDFE